MTAEVRQTSAMDGGYFQGYWADFDEERATRSSVDRDGRLHLRRDAAEHVLTSTGVPAPSMPPSATPDILGWWLVSATVAGAAAAFALLARLSSDPGWPGSTILTTTILAMATVSLVVASVVVCDQRRLSRPDRDRALDEARDLTGLPLTARQARHFLAMTHHFVRNDDGTVWAVHDGVVYRSGTTTA